MDIKPKKLAVLIDADNSSVNSIQFVLEEIAKYGIASVKRVYGDWSSEALKNWRDILLPHAITPVQQFAYTKGKDATDMILIIDAMDLLYSGALDGFCIVSSDSDFTPLASRIRENGLMVYGFGKAKTPEAFRKACDKFIYIENLIIDELKQDVIKPAHHKESKVEQPSLDIDKHTLNLIYKAVKDNADESGWVSLSAVGKYINTIKPDFDSRSYGYSKLSGLIRALDIFETKTANSQMYLRKRSFSTFVKFVQKAIHQHADVNGWAKISDIIGSLQHTDLNIRDYKEAIKSIHSGWVEFAENASVEMIKINKAMP